MPKKSTETLSPKLDSHAAQLGAILDRFLRNLGRRRGMLGLRHVLRRKGMLHLGREDPLLVIPRLRRWGRRILFSTERLQRRGGTQ